MHTKDKNRAEGSKPAILQIVSKYQHYLTRIALVVRTLQTSGADKFRKQPQVRSGKRTEEKQINEETCLNLIIDINFVI